MRIHPGKWLLESFVKTVGHLDTDEAIRATITDEETGRSLEAVGTGEDEALERACQKFGISERDLDEEMD